MKVYVVIMIEQGWDCIDGVFDTLLKAQDFLVNNRGQDRSEVEENDTESYFIHEVKVQ